MYIYVHLCTRVLNSFIAVLPQDLAVVHLLDATHKFALPVSITTSNFCAGVPMSTSPRYEVCKQLCIYRIEA